MEEAEALGKTFTRQCEAEAEAVLELKEAGSERFLATLRAFVWRGRVGEKRMQALEDAYLEDMTVARLQEIVATSMFDVLPARWVASQRRKKLIIGKEATAVFEEALAKEEAQKEGEKGGGKEGAGMGLDALLGVHGDANDPAVLLGQMLIALSSCSLHDFANRPRSKTVC
jgi:hypothetical protein